MFFFSIVQKRLKKRNRLYPTLKKMNIYNFYIRNLEEVKRIVNECREIVHIKDDCEWTPLDVAIEYGDLDIAQFLCGMGGRPNLDIYRDGEWTPMHTAAWWGKTTILKWVFKEGILPLRVLNIKDHNGKTPLDRAIFQKKWETVAFLRRLLHLDPVFLAMQRAKHDYHQCVLRRLPDELLDMVVDEAAARHNLKVVW